jgi:archaeoflavoprotein AfpA
MTEGPSKKRKVAWGITGSGDRLAETIEVMKQIEKQYDEAAEIQVFLSKAATTVLKYYRLENELKTNFKHIYAEVDSNTPFLAGWLQQRKYEFMLIAPATSNTVAKIACQIADTMLTNAVSMGLKASAPIYIMPTDLEEGVTFTKLPKGETMKLQVRHEDAENVKKISKMEHLSVFAQPKEIWNIFKKHFPT